MTQEDREVAFEFVLRTYINMFDDATWVPNESLARDAAAKIRTCAVIDKSELADLRARAERYEKAIAPLSEHGNELVSTEELNRYKRALWLLMNKYGDPIYQTINGTFGAEVLYMGGEMDAEDVLLIEAGMIGTTGAWTPAAHAFAKSMQEKETL